MPNGDPIGKALSRIINPDYGEASLSYGVSKGGRSHIKFSAASNYVVGISLSGFTTVGAYGELDLYKDKDQSRKLTGGAGVQVRGGPWGIVAPSVRAGVRFGDGGSNKARGVVGGGADVFLGVAAVGVHANVDTGGKVGGEVKLTIPIF